MTRLPTATRIPVRRAPLLAPCRASASPSPSAFPPGDGPSATSDIPSPATRSLNGSHPSPSPGSTNGASYEETGAGAGAGGGLLGLFRRYQAQTKELQAKIQSLGIAGLTAYGTY
jgi:hypothetical protein